MLTVTFYELKNGKDTPTGSIRWDGDSFTITADWLREILDQPIPRNGRLLMSRTEPEAWLRELCREYRSAYLRATEAKE